MEELASPVGSAPLVGGLSRVSSLLRDHLSRFGQKFLVLLDEVWLDTRMTTNDAARTKWINNLAAAWNVEGEGNFYIYADLHFTGKWFAHYGNRIGNTFCQTDLGPEARDGADEELCPICHDVNEVLGRPVQ